MQYPPTSQPPIQQPRRNGCLNAIGSVFQGIDLARRLVMNILFLVLLVLFLSVFQDPIPVVPQTAALVVSPQGNIVEQLSGDPVARAIAEIQGADEPQTLLQDLLDVIDAAREDERIHAIVLDLNYMGGGGLNKLQELRAALDAFKASGKKVIAAANYYTRSSYYLASIADEIYLHSEGLALVEGYGIYRTHYKDAIDKLMIDWNVFRVGEYKSAVEPYTRATMSPETRESAKDWLGDLWRSYLEDVAASRNLPSDALEEALENFDVYVEKASGNVPQALLQLGMIDVIGGKQDVRDRMIELVGEQDDTFSQVYFSDYLLTLGSDRPRMDRGGDAVAVILASGPILDGEQMPGSVGGVSTARLVRKARLDDSIKALVLRVDSGGGSQFASEVIRKELELFRDSGKPLIASLSSVAASGGYWIAVESDEIWSSANTITGSIGIYSMIPTFQRPLAELGVQVDGIGTNWMSGALRPDRELHPRLATILQASTNSNYDQFLDLVAEERDMTVDEVDSIARGRVWSGADAQSIGLVDQLGGLHDAIAAAASRTELGEDYSVRYLEPELDLTDEVLLQFLSRSDEILAPVIRGISHTVEQAARRPAVFDSALGRFVDEQARLLQRFNDPRGIYAHCQCEIDW